MWGEAHTERIVIVFRVGLQGFSEIHDWNFAFIAFAPC